MHIFLFSQFGLNVVCVGSANTLAVVCKHPSLLHHGVVLCSSMPVWWRAFFLVQSETRISLSPWGPLFVLQCWCKTVDFFVIRRRITKHYHKHKKKISKKRIDGHVGNVVKLNLWTACSCEEYILLCWLSMVLQHFLFCTLWAL